MDEIIISNENNILHLNNQDNYVDYTIYDNHGHSLDGGQLDNDEELDKVQSTNEILSIIRERFAFSEPFIRLTGDKANNLLELIEMEDFKNMQSKVDSIKTKSYINDEMELTK